jgi:hypothetical protein
MITIYSEESFHIDPRVIVTLISNIITKGMPISMDEQLKWSKVLGFSRACITNFNFVSVISIFPRILM